MQTNVLTHRQVSFKGDGSKLFVIQIVNLFLTIITLGLYYPWAKAAVLKYLYQETELEGSRFTFHGTGKEMFKGFIKTVSVIVVLYGLLALATATENTIIIVAGFLIYLAAILVLIPVAIHGSTRYRMSRTTWRGIHFGYRGNLKELIQEFLVGGFLSIITLGIYSSWLTINLRKYIIGNIRFGSIQFSYHGKGDEYFWLNFKGVFLTYITLGIYFFWYAKDLFNYFIDNIQMEQNGRTIRLQSQLKGSSYFVFMLTNLLLIVFTLGLASPWVTVRTMRFIFTNIIIDGDLDLNAIQQTEEDYKNATSEEMADLLNIDLV